MNSKLEAVKGQFQRALQRLEDVLRQEKNEYIRDSAIKRFEYTFDLSWKFLKEFLEKDRGVICVSPKGCFREAYRQGFLEYDDFWIEMTDMRNQTVHTYREETAEEIFNKLPAALEHFRLLLSAVQK